VFAYLAAVVNGKIKPEKDLSSFAVNSVVVEILLPPRNQLKQVKPSIFQNNLPKFPLKETFNFDNCNYYLLWMNL
jgi:hypothetical protein